VGFFLVYCRFAAFMGCALFMCRCKVFICWQN
jgi:hypothetical protein